MRGGERARAGERPGRGPYVMYASRGTVECHQALMALSLLLQTLSLWMVTYLSNWWLAMVFGVVLGATSGLQRTVSTVAWAKYYGRRHLGSITGVTTTVTVGASALGPMPMGIARDLLGSYGLTLKLLAILPLVLAVASLFVDRPEKK